jgi:lysophospholipase L1-like esterase
MPEDLILRIAEARAILDDLLAELGALPAEPEPPVVLPPTPAPLTENVLLSIADTTVLGVSETLVPFEHATADGDIIVYLKCQRSGVSTEAAIFTLENAARTRALSVGFGYNFPGTTSAASQISLRSLPGAEALTAAGVTGTDHVSQAIEVALHWDSDRKYLNLWQRSGSTQWVWRDSVAGASFQIDQVRMSTRSGAGAPTSQDVTFSDIMICRPNFVSIGDSITAGHNYFDPNGAHYAGRDNGLSQWQAHCWPALGLRNNLVVNKGIGSQTTTQVRNRIAEGIRHGNPVLYLSVQNNDAGKGISQAQRTDNIQASIHLANAAGVQYVVLYGAVCPNNNATSAAYYKTWRTTHLPTLVDYLGYIEIMDALENPTTGNIQVGLAVDGTHPTVEGYTLMGQKIAAEALALLI